VIVPARDAEATLARTLAALRHQDLDGEYEVIVVDDGSLDGTAALAQAAGAPVKVLTQAREGPAQARNRGAAAARGEVLAFCDADVYPTPGWLRCGIDALRAADIVQGHVLPDPQAALGPFDRSIWITSEVGLFETASLFVRRATFDRVEGFQEWISPRRGKALAEDVWFGYRARRLGATSAFSPEALAHHEVFRRSWREYVLERQRLGYFPAMAARIPELRRAFLYRRVFLNPRTLRLDLALLALATGAALRSPLPLAGTVPYLRTVRRHSRRAGVAPPGPAVVAAADLAADVVGLAALLGGSIRFGALVI